MTVIEKKIRDVLDDPTFWPFPSLPREFEPACEWHQWNQNMCASRRAVIHTGDIVTTLFLLKLLKAMAVFRWWRICCWRMSFFPIIIITYVIRGSLKDRSTLVNLNEKRLNGGYIGSSTHSHNGLGNQLFHYVSLYAIGRRLGRKPFETSALNGYNESSRHIFHMFPNLADHFEILEQKYYDNDCCKHNVTFGNYLIKYDEPSRLSDLQYKYLLTSGEYYESYRYFHRYREDVKRILACNSSVLHEVHQRRRLLFREDREHKLCVHIRRGDFIKSPVLLHSERLFTSWSVPFVIDYLKTQNTAQNISVVVIGDDPLWSQSALENVTEPVYIYWRSSSHAVDWCFAVNSCDSLILTASSSTNGWWIGYMIWPQPVFYRKRSYKCGCSMIDERQLFASDYYPSPWIPLEDNEICDGEEQKPVVSS